MLRELAPLAPRRDGKGKGVAEQTLRRYRSNIMHLYPDIELIPFPKTAGHLRGIRETEIEKEVVLDGIDVMVSEAMIGQGDVFRSRRVLGKIPVGAYRHASLVVADAHSTDTDFMRDSLISAMTRAGDMIAEWKPDVLSLLIAGDWVSGNDIFRGQPLRNSISRSHWQAAVGAILLKEVYDIVKPKGVQAVEMIYVQGNHDRDRNGNYGFATVGLGVAVHGLPISYAGDELVHNLGDDETPHYALCVHGFSASRFRPQSPSFLDRMQRRVSDLNMLRTTEDRIHRVVHGHVHWLDTSFRHSLALTFDCCGGWQHNSRAALGKTQRPCGAILYLMADGKLAVKEVTPDSEVFYSELERGDLEFENLGRMSRYLKQAYLAEHPEEDLDG